jgi:molybdopterin molybdotransferase
MTSTEQIAASIQGYDPNALRADQVHTFLARLVTPVADTETVGILQALGRVLADDVVSPINVPPHDNSAMDGFAFDGRQLMPGQALRLQVVGTTLAGNPWQGAVETGQCVRITTGAVMPGQLDTVIPLELAEVQGDTITIPAGSIRQGSNRRLTGEDLRQGQPALQRGQTIGPAALGLVASLGLPTVPVYRRIKVACFSTGDELLTLGECPREGAVFDSNRYTLFGRLTRLGIEVIDMGIVGDDPPRLASAFQAAAQQADAIITSGGVSMGEADHTKAMMKRLGDVVFWHIAMRPGRPMAVGRIEAGERSALLFGLPGNPVAVMVAFLTFVRPALQQLMGSHATAPIALKARSLEDLKKKPGRTEYQRGIVVRAADGSLTVRTTGNQGSGVLSSMVQANGLIVLSHDQDRVSAGEWVDVLMFEGAV